MKNVYDMGRSGQPQLVQPEIPMYSGRNYMKDTTSTASIEHAANRRASPPGTTPAFFRAKQAKNMQK